MFLRQNKRRKNGKTHRYFSVVENRRTAGGGSTQRQVLYLGEINDSQQEAWRRTLEVFDEDRRQYCELSLFPDDRPLPLGEVNAISVKLDQMQLRRPRCFGDCWLGCWLWDKLELSSFWNNKLADDRGEVLWASVLQLLVVNRLIDPGSELRIHRQWFLRSAMDELLGVDFAVAGKDRLYRCLDRIVEHKDALCQHLAQRWKTLFDTSFDVLLYDLTSTYFEGLCEQIPKARHGYSRDGRSDCRQVVIALVVTVDGLPLAYEVLAGNTTDKTTLRQFLQKIEQMYGKARRTWVMDRGIPTEATLAEMRATGTQYLVGTPRSMLGKLDQHFADKPWQQVHEAMTVKLLEHEGEYYVLAHSDARQLKEKASRPTSAACTRCGAAAGKAPACASAVTRCWEGWRCSRRKPGACHRQWTCMSPMRASGPRPRTSTTAWKPRTTARRWIAMARTSCGPTPSAPRQSRPRQAPAREPEALMQMAQMQP